MKKTCGGCINYEAGRCAKTKTRTSELRKACKGWAGKAEVQA